MTTKTARAARAKARQWWPELIAGGFCLLMVATHAFTAAAAFAGMIAIGWGMCARHKQLPLHQKVERVTDLATEILDEVRADHEDAAVRPRLYVVPHD